MMQRNNNNKSYQAKQWLHLAAQVNNTAVSLTERGLFGKAIELLHALATAVPENGGVPRLTKALLDGRGVLEVCPANGDTLQNVEVIVLCDDDDDDDAQDDVQAAIVYGPSAHTVFPLRLVQDKDEQDCKVQLAHEQVYITAVALYNHAMATRGRVASSPEKQRHATKSCKALRTAKTLLEQPKRNNTLLQQTECDFAVRWNILLALVSSALGEANDSSDRYYSGQVVLAGSASSVLQQQQQQQAPNVNKSSLSWFKPNFAALRFHHKKQSLAVAA